jgi:signal transduction histidine kinase/streptogramin lyase
MDGGLNRLDQEAGTFYAYQAKMVDPNGINNNDVRAIYEDHLGILWIGTNGGGLNRLDREINLFTHFVHDDRFPDTIVDNRVTAIIEDRRGNLWVGTHSGLDLMDASTGRFIHFHHNPADPTSLSDDYIHVLYEDRSGNLWVGTNNGLSRMDPATRSFKNFFNDPKNPLSLSDNRVLSILETPDGALWLGTLLGGLERFDPGQQTFQHYTQKQGLPSGTVYGVLADRNGYLWMSTNRGISRFDPVSETFRNYDRSDGLQSYEFNPGAFFENTRGRIYFGGIQGFNAFDPANVEDNGLPPQIVVTAFKKFNQTNQKDLTGGEKINLSYQDNFISFEFAALDYSAPEKNQYAYKLEGFDKDWIYAGNRRYASYTNLRGGHYTFKVIGSNQDGIWNETGASVEIVVTPPVWENWLFIGLVALTLVGASGLGYRWRMKNVQAQNRTLEDQVNDRTREIERRRQVAEGLREILAILNSNRSLRETLDAIVLQAMRLMHASAVVIFRRDQDGNPGIVASNLNPDPNPSNPPGLPGWLTQPLLDGRVLCFTDIARQARTRPEMTGMPFGHYAALLAVPLIVNDKTDGGLVMLFDQARDFSEDDFQIAVSFADHAALSIGNAQLRSQAEENAASAERNRLARDLHDAVTQTLFATSLIAEVLPRLWDRNPVAGKEKLSEIRELTRGALAEMRTLLMELRPSALMDVPLPLLLQQLCDAFNGRARVPIHFEGKDPVDLPASVKTGFYRIAQEALNNIQKHAHATQVNITLHDAGDCVVLCIQDNGVGFDPGSVPPNHLGLRIMEERAHAMGAIFTMESGATQGTRVTVTWQKT